MYMYIERPPTEDRKGNAVHCKIDLWTSIILLYPPCIKCFYTTLTSMYMYSHIHVHPHIHIMQRYRMHVHVHMYNMYAHTLYIYMHCVLRQYRLTGGSPPHWDGHQWERNLGHLWRDHRSEDEPLCGEGGGGGGSGRREDKGKRMRDVHTMYIPVQEWRARMYARVDWMGLYNVYQQVKKENLVRLPNTLSLLLSMSSWTALKLYTVSSLVLPYVSNDIWSTWKIKGPGSIFHVGQRSCKKYASLETRLYCQIFMTCIPLTQGPYKPQCNIVQKLCFIHVHVYTKTSHFISENKSCLQVCCFVLHCIYDWVHIYTYTCGWILSFFNVKYSDCLLPSDLDHNCRIPSSKAMYLLDMCGSVFIYM